MADQIQITGLVVVKVQVPSGSLVTLGETMDMAEVEERAFWHNVPGDRHGGPQGPPIDIQYLGSIAVVTLELSRWDATHLDTLRKRAVNATLGTVALADVGSLMLGSKAIRCLLHSTARPINFPTCIIREAFAYGMGTKFTAARLQFEAHRNPTTGVLFNSTTT